MRKLKLLLITIFVFALSIMLGSEIYATNTMNLNIKDIRPYTNSKYTVLTTNGNVHTIFKIMKNNGTGYVYEDALYCLRSGLGFGDTEIEDAELSQLADVPYTERYNLKTDATAVMNYYRTEIGYANLSNTEYNSILWIIDNMYLPENEDADEMKARLLEKAGIGNSVLTDDDIEFIQQMALWYYSNYDERNSEDGNTLSLPDEIALSQWTEINGEELDEQKARQVDILYRYFINNALLYNTDYGIGDTREISQVKTEYKVNDNLKTVTKNSGYTIVGPFSISKTNGNIAHTLEVEVTDNNGKVIPEQVEGTPIVYVVSNPTDVVPSVSSIKETIGTGEFYLKISNRWTEYDLSDVNIELNVAYDKMYKTTATLWLATNADQPVIKIEREEIKEFDLALRKNITEVNGKTIVNSKEPVIDLVALEKDTTADYKHRKDPVEVKNGDKVTYTISVFNEGELHGIVTKIIDYLPEGLEFEIANNSEFVEFKTDYTGIDLTGKKYAYTFDTATRKLEILPINGEYLFELDPFDGTNLDIESIELVCTVTATTDTADKILTNIATMEYKASNAEVLDRDSSSDPSSLTLPTNGSDWGNYSGDANNRPYLGDTEFFYKGQEDDDDFDKVVIKGVPFDLALRKFITKVNGVEITTRIPEIDTSKLNTTDESTGETITTATYTHSKEPVTVKQGDIVTYTIRVYNEGELDGYAMGIADYLPEGLGYLVGYKENTNNLWHPVLDNTNKTLALVGDEGLYSSEEAVKNLKIEDFDEGIDSLSNVQILTGKAKIYSDALEDEIIKAYNPELKVSDIDSKDNWQQTTNGTDGLYYKDVEVTCIVLAENTFEGTLRNIAEVQLDKAVNENNEQINAEDRDSTPANADTNNYNPPADNSTYQQDDDDYELLELKYFDLALRKFITAVNDDAVTTRIPEVKINAEGNLEYIHDKTPVYVANSDLVTYTLRVYNEGTVAGYAMEIADDIPDGLVFLPEHTLNKEYGWKMYDKNGEETDDFTKAVEIRTTYLNSSLLNPYDATKAISATEPLNPDYAEVKVVFQVIEENITQEDRIVINKAQITEDKAVDENGNAVDLEDEDSIPDEWNEGEDDQDIEKIYVQKFDLALLKWVTKTIVTVDGKTTTTETGFTPYDDPEPIAKVVLDKKKLNKTTVKFAYNIIIMNQGEIEGYATEITDYIPEGLEFDAKDNPLWTKEGDNKITTRALEGTLLKPGESATVEVIFTWKNDADNLGLKTNIAEISEDYNEKGSKDIDSDPDNVETKDYDKQQEDDDDKALVILEIKTGGGANYIWLGLTVLLIIAGGIILIQKFVM